MLDYEIIEYRVYYNKFRCYKRCSTEEQAIKVAKKLLKEFSDVNIRKYQNAIIDF